MSSVFKHAKVFNYFKENSIPGQSGFKPLAIQTKTKQETCKRRLFTTNITLHLSHHDKRLLLDTTAVDQRYRL